jgi:hypothetical protein
MAHSEDSSAEEVTVVPPKSKSKSKPKPKSKPKSKVDKPTQVDDKKDTAPETNRAWILSHTLYLIDEFKHQTEIGKGNDGGLKTDAWKQVLDNFNKKFKLKDSLSRLKNHIQKVQLVQLFHLQFNTILFSNCSYTSQYLVKENLQGL